MQYLLFSISVIAFALSLNAQHVRVGFGGLVLAPPCGTETESSFELRFVCTGDRPDEYFIRFPKAMLSGDSTSTEIAEAPIELLNLGEPVVDWAVVQRPGGLPYRYSYRLTNGSHARRAIWSWALVVPGEDDSTALYHPLWRFTSPASLATNARIAPQASMLEGPELRRSATLGKFARWTTAIDEYPVAPGRALSDFVVDSAFRPGWTTAYASAGKGIEIPFEIPAEVYADLTVLQRPENYQSFVLTVGPKFGPEISPRWIAADWHLGIQKMIVHGSLTAESRYVRDVLQALERVATAESNAVTLAIRAKPASGIEEKVHQAITLALGPEK